MNSVSLKYSKKTITKYSVNDTDQLANASTRFKETVYEEDASKDDPTKSGYARIEAMENRSFDKSFRPERSRWSGLKDFSMYEFLGIHFALCRQFLLYRTY